MDMRMALINWKNFFRQMVGLEKQYPVKVMRVGVAKEFEMLHISKSGDVGYNLTAVEDIVIPCMSEDDRAIHKDLSELRERLVVEERNAMNFGRVPQSNIVRGQIEKIDERLKELMPKAVIPTGVKIQMPTNLWCSIEARSSSSSKMLITPDAIIDSGYTGEMFVVVYNFGYTDHQVTVGDQLAQLIFHERITITPKETTRFTATERGEAGFGSTGAKAKKAV